MTDEASEQKRFSLLFAVLPLFVFLGLAGVFYSLLSTEGRDTSSLPSALLNEPAPLLTVPPLEAVDLPGMTPDMFKGKISVVNVFASWCLPCRHEHPQILRLGEDNRFQLVGINHRDSTQGALDFLAELGNPYDVIGVDDNARASIEWGVYGIPETFLVDGDGIIFHKTVGPINENILREIILPLLEERLADSS